MVSREKFWALLQKQKVAYQNADVKMRDCKDKQSTQYQKLKANKQKQLDKYRELENKFNREILPLLNQYRASDNQLATSQKRLANLKKVQTGLANKKKKANALGKQLVTKEKNFLAKQKDVNGKDKKAVADYKNEWKKIGSTTDKFRKNYMQLEKEIRANADYIADEEANQAILKKEIASLDKQLQTAYKNFK